MLLHYTSWDSTADSELPKYGQGQRANLDKYNCDNDWPDFDQKELQGGWELMSETGNYRRN